MAIALHSYKIDDDGEIRVRHTFYAATIEAADALLKAHANGCKAFGPAFDEGDTIEIEEEIDDDEMPDAETLEEITEEVEEDEEGEESDAT